MAEIHVERKARTGIWAWVLLALVVIAAVAWYLATKGYITIPGITRTALNQGAIEWQRIANGLAATWPA
jgi:hypothetical protein